MSDPFDSPRRKIARAKVHIANLEREVIRFTKNAGSLVRFTEADAEHPNLTVHKVRMTKAIPDGISEIAGDALGNLREALDHALYSVAIASGKTDPRSAYFPFGKTAENVDNAIKGNCKDVPEGMYPLLRAFHSHEGGNEVLYTLNLMTNSKKHAVLTAFGAAAIDGGMNVEGTGYFSMPSPHVWDHAKNEMELITLAPDAKFNAHFRFLITVAFSGFESIQRMPAPTVLYEITCEVESVLAGIEAESRRLGIIQ